MAASCLPAYFKLLLLIQFRNCLPKTSTERVAKRALKKEKGLLKKAIDLERYKKLLGARDDSDAWQLHWG